MTGERPKAQTQLSVVAPVFNESAVIDQFVEEIRSVIARLPEPLTFEIVLVNDGSSDDTPEKLDALSQRFPGEVKAVHLARNFGHSAAVMAGLAEARGDAIVLLDSDLQDDPVVFPDMLAKWREGYDVVYAIRSSRRESLLIRVAMAGFYRFLSAISDTPIPQHAGNYSLMSRRVVDMLVSLPERNRYLPGLRAWAGFRQIGVKVPRRSRHDKRSRVGIGGLWRLAMNAIFSFSYMPLLFFRILGAVAVMSSLMMILYAVYSKLFTDRAVVAWASQIVAISFFGGMTLFGLGVVGEYVARVYDELKRRPPYVIDRIVGSDEAVHIPAYGARVSPGASESAPRRNDTSPLPQAGERPRARAV